MILADKIIENRKKNGWSQEELADKLGVSRQSVSKWESAQAVPDMKKIVQMAEVFGVSTDYLLKDEIELPADPETAPVDSGIDDEVRVVTMEDASAFLDHNEKAASTVSTGVMLCVLSPVIMIALNAFSSAGKLSVSEDTASFGGLIILLIMVAIAVAMFIMTGLKGKRFEFLENQSIETAYGVSGMAKERRNDYSDTHSRLLLSGIMLCVIAVIPMLLMMMVGESSNSDFMSILGVAVLLVIVAIGVKLIVMTSMRKGGYDKLLEEGDYTRINKRVSKYDGIYWAIVLAIYLGWSFITNRWEITWLVWPVAGVLYAAYREIIKAIVRSK